MNISDKLKSIIFKKLYQDLSNVEIIPYNGSMWFIDREERYWYFELENNGNLYWRYDFFPSFFSMFSLEREDFEQILASWVEEVLNHRVSATGWYNVLEFFEVEQVLNHNVSTARILCCARWK